MKIWDDLVLGHAVLHQKFEVSSSKNVRVMHKKPVFQTYLRF